MTLWRKLDPFMGKASVQRIRGLFLYKEEKVVQVVQIMLGNGFKKLTHRFRTNMDIYSLVMAWGLDLGEPVNEVRRVMKTLVHKYFLVDIERILQRAIPGVGLVKIDGMDGGGPKLVDLNHLFIKWQESRTKD